MLTFARDISLATDNVFNISVASSLGQLGYGTAAPSSRVDDKLWDHVTFDEHLITLPPDVEIDLGGFGKGWIIDSLGELLHSLGHSQFIINGGGDILVSSDEPIELALEHPLDPTKQIGSTRITHGALAVSSTKKRVWKQGDAQYHHIIDPQTGLPSTSPIATTYVRADTALIADTLATVLLIDPSQNEKLTQAYNLKTILINEDQLL
jgi:thiamine biosynthesis lipoprotein